MYLRIRKYTRQFFLTIPHFDWGSGGNIPHICLHLYHLPRAVGLSVTNIFRFPLWGIVKKNIGACICIYTRVYANTWQGGPIGPPPALNRVKVDSQFQPPRKMLRTPWNWSQILLNLFRQQMSPFRCLEGGEGSHKGDIVIFFNSFLYGGIP